jgi:hypothetical protein
VGLAKDAALALRISDGIPVLAGACHVFGLPRLSAKAAPGACLIHAQPNLIPSTKGLAWWAVASALVSLCALCSTGAVKWRLEFASMASPAARLLAGGDGRVGGAFALMGRLGRSPRVYAARDRDNLLKAIQTAALRRLGVTLAGAPAHWGQFSHRHEVMVAMLQHFKWMQLARQWRGVAGTAGHSLTCKPGSEQCAERHGCT